MCELQTLKGLFSEKYTVTPLRLTAEGYAYTSTYNAGYPSPTPKYIQFQNPTDGAWINIEQMGTIIAGCDFKRETMSQTVVKYHVFTISYGDNYESLYLSYYPRISMSSGSTYNYIEGIPITELHIRLCDENYEWLFETVLFNETQSGTSDSSRIAWWYHNTYLPDFNTLRNYYISVAQTV